MFKVEIWEVQHLTPTAKHWAKKKKKKKTEGWQTGKSEIAVACCHRKWSNYRHGGGGGSCITEYS